MDRFATILTFTHPMEAAIIRSKLESEGIECFLKNEYTINTNPFSSNALGGVELQVEESDLTRAKEIIEAAHSGYIIEADTNSNEGRIICPKCGADQADRGQYKVLMLLLSLLYFVPLFLFGRKRHCFKCGVVLPEN